MAKISRQALLEMIRNGKKEELEETLSKNKLSTTMLEGKVGEWSLMLEAVNAKDIEIVNLLLDHGADINGKAVINPLHASLSNEQFEIAKVLLDRGVDINNADKDGSTDLMCFAQFEEMGAVHFLIENGADINCKDEDGIDALYCAILNNESTDVIQYLLRNGADINTEDSKGVSALEFIMNYPHNDYSKTIAFFKDNSHLLNEKNGELLKTLV